MIIGGENFFLLTVGLLPNASHFLLQMKVKVDQIVTNFPVILHILQWTDVRINMEKPHVNIRLAYALLALTQVRVLDSGSALANALNQSLIRDLAVDLSFILDLGLRKGRTRALTRALNLLLDRIGRDELSPQVKFDYSLYYSWAFAELFADSQFMGDDEDIATALNSYRDLPIRMIKLSEQLGIFNTYYELITSTIPSPDTNTQDWQKFADQIKRLLRKRDLIYEQQFTDEEIEKLNAYFTANELLVQCLNVAVVPDREAILAGLLAPPAA